jgi:hypothetical protein
MRILENNDTIKVICPGCKSVLAVEVQDVQATDISHGREQPQWVNCPQCSRDVGIPLAAIPMHWRAVVFADFD